MHDVISFVNKNIIYVFLLLCLLISANYILYKYMVNAYEKSNAEYNNSALVNSLVKNKMRLKDALIFQKIKNEIALTETESRHINSLIDNISYYEIAIANSSNFLRQ